MSIIFEQFGSDETPLPVAVGLGSLRIHGYGYGQTLAVLGAAGFGVVNLKQVNTGMEPPPPALIAGDGIVPLLAAYSFAPEVYGPATGSGVLPLGAFGSASAQLGAGRVPVFGFGLSMTGDDELPPPTAADDAVYVEDVVRLGGTGERHPTYLTRNAVAFNSQQKNRFQGSKLATSNVAFSDDPAFVVRLLIEEGVVFSALASTSYLQIAKAISRLLVQGHASHYAEAVAKVTEGLVAGALAEAMQVGDIADTVALNAAVAPYYTLVAQLVERLLLAGQALPHYTLTALIEERLLMQATVGNQIDLIAVLRDGVGFAATLGFDDGQYIAWVLNTESKGLSRYTNYPFNSFAKVAGIWYGATSQGLFELGGSTDAGEQIHARIRLGLSAMGTRKLKRIPESFIGYSSTGTLLMKVITVEEVSGEKQAAIYKMDVRAAGVTRENRIQFGRGLKSVDWDFELQNVDGADFDLQSIEFRPVVLDRRTRG